MEDQKPRVDRDGNLVWDVLENPKAVERKKREAEEKARLEAEANEPWSRAKVERELGRLALKPPVAVMDGREIFDRLNLHGVDLSGLDLSGLDLSGANMHGANLTAANLSNCRLVESNLSEALLTGASIENANAVGANLSKSCLCSAKIGKTHLMAVNLSDCCYQETDGLDLVEKPLTPAEDRAAKYKQSEGFRVDTVTDQKGAVKFVYVGSRMEKANITGMKSTCQRRGK
jgi:uncharacterized protein YjbI with pentapeptide repeats